MHNRTMNRTAVTGAVRPSPGLILALGAAASISCASVATQPVAAPSPNESAARTGTLARIYYWRARPGKLDEYGRYVRDVAEPIDREAQRAGAFVSVTTFVSRDSSSAWTHMRLFILRDSAQLSGLSPALDAAGVRVEPDSVKRRVRGQYSATLRDRVGDATVEVMP